METLKHHIDRLERFCRSTRPHLCVLLAILVVVAILLLLFFFGARRLCRPYGQDIRARLLLLFGIPRNRRRCGRGQQRVDCLYPKANNNNARNARLIVNNDDKQGSTTVLLELEHFQFYTASNSSINSSAASPKMDTFQDGDDSGRISKNFVDDDATSRLLVPIFEPIITNTESNLPSESFPGGDIPLTVSKTEVDEGCQQEEEAANETAKLSVISESSLTANSSFRNVQNSIQTTTTTPIVVLEQQNILEQSKESFKSNVFQCMCYKQIEMSDRASIARHVHYAKYKTEAVHLEYGFTLTSSLPFSSSPSSLSSHTRPTHSSLQEWKSRHLTGTFEALRMMDHPNIAQLTGILSLPPSSNPQESKSIADKSNTAIPSVQTGTESDACNISISNNPSPLLLRPMSLSPLSHLPHSPCLVRPSSHSARDRHHQKKANNLETSDYCLQTIATNELLIYNNNKHPSFPLGSFGSEPKTLANEHFKSGLKLQPDKEIFNNAGALGRMAPSRRPKLDVESGVEHCDDDDDCGDSLHTSSVTRHDHHHLHRRRHHLAHYEKEKVSSILSINYFVWSDCHGPSLAEVIHSGKLPLLESQLNSSYGNNGHSKSGTGSRRPFELDSFKINRGMRLALLNDIVQAMLYLHSSGIVPYHGTLNLRNCYLDARRWSVKVANFGWSAAVKLTTNKPTTNETDNNNQDTMQNKLESEEEQIQTEQKSANILSGKNIPVHDDDYYYSLAPMSEFDLLNIAPEHLNAAYALLLGTSRRTAVADNQSINKLGSPAGDVYSFSLCIYQFIFELLPFETYYRHSLSIPQILRRIRNPAKYHKLEKKQEYEESTNREDVNIYIDSPSPTSRCLAPSANTQLSDKCENIFLEPLADNSPESPSKKYKNFKFFRPELISLIHYRERVKKKSLKKEERNISERSRNGELWNVGDYGDLIILMQKCWHQSPAKRPTFEQICRAISLMQMLASESSRSQNILDCRQKNGKNQQPLSAGNLCGRPLEEKFGGVPGTTDYDNNVEGSNRINLVLDMFRTQNRRLQAANALSNSQKFNSQALLDKVLPNSVSRSLMLGEFVKPEKFDSVTIAFSDIVGFTTLASYSSPLEVVEVLNKLFTAFDCLLKRFDVYKVETIGDAYMVASGVPLRNENHECQIGLLALEMLKVCTNFKMEHMPGVPLQVRIGIHTGPVVGGVVGTQNPRYCLFGDTVNIASRLESTGQPNMIHVSRATQRALKTARTFVLKHRGSIELRGRGRYPTYWLLGTKTTGQTDDEVICSLTEQQSSSLDEIEGHGITDESIFTNIGLKQQQI